MKRKSMLHFLIHPILLVTFLGGAFSQTAIGPLSSSSRKYVWEVGSNYYSSQLLGTNTQMYLGKYNSNRHRDLIQWDLPDNILPDGAHITQVRLDFTANPQGGSPQLSAALAKVNYDITGATSAAILFAEGDVPGNYIGGGEALSGTFSQTFTEGAFTQAIEAGLTNNRFTLIVKSLHELLWDYWYYVPTWTPALTIWIAPVEVDQERASNNERLTGTTVGRWNGSTFTDLQITEDPAIIDVIIGSREVLKGRQETVSDPTEKYRVWRRNTEDQLDTVQNHRGFTVSPFDERYISRFNPTDPTITIKTDLIDAPGTTGGNIQFHDPWYIDLQDGAYGNNWRNRGMVEPRQFHNRSVGSTGWQPDFTTIYPEGPYEYNGVFLNQPIESGKPYYSVGAPAMQSMAPGSLEWNFLNWKVVNGAAAFQNATDDSTGVVFSQANTTVAARYKAHLASSVASATGTNSQRKLVDDAILGGSYLTYESAGEIWLSQWSGSTWGKEVQVSNGTGAPIVFSYPSIASTGGLADDPEVDGPALYTVYKKYDGSYTSVFFREKRGSSWLSPVQINTTALSGDVAAKPVIARTNTQWQIWEPWTRPMLVAVWETSNGIRQRTANGTTNGGWTWEPNDDVLASTGHHNPSISSTYLHYGYDREFLYITFDNGADVFLTHFDGNWDDPAETVPASVSPTSWGSQVTANTYNPENHEVHVVWEATGGEEQGAGGGESVGAGTPQHKVMYQPNIGGSWRDAHEFESGIPGIHYYRPTIATVSSGNRVWAWDDGTAAYKAVYDGNEWSITEVYGTGTYPNLEQEGTTGKLSEVKFASMGTGTPYRLQFSSETSSPLGDDPIALPEVRHGRRVEAVRISTNEEPNKFVSLELSGLNLVMANGQRSPLGFVHAGDSLLNEDNAWSKLSTLPVTLTNEVDSIFLDGNIETSSLRDLVEDGQVLRLWLDLVDARTGDVIRRIGTQRTLEQDTSHFFHFRERLLGLNGREVFIRPSIVGLARRLENVLFTLVHVHSVYRDTSGTPQSPLASMQTSEPLPTRFELHQNYPNPFNPTTEIKFDLPDAGNVSLVVYDVLGRQVAELAGGYHAAGYHTATWNASGQASGVYFARFTVTNAEGKSAFTKVSKLVLMK